MDQIFFYVPFGIGDVTQGQGVSETALDFDQNASSGVSLSSSLESGTSESNFDSAVENRTSSQKGATPISVPAIAGTPTRRYPVRVCKPSDRL